jgi:hypothetical protein
MTISTLVLSLLWASACVTSDSSPRASSTLDASTSTSDSGSPFKEPGGPYATCRMKPDGWEKPLAPPTSNGPPFCKVDGDCLGVGGHCTDEDYRTNIRKCVFDECFGNGDCLATERCDCSRNSYRCISAECASDADCNGRPCRPTYGCGGAVAGYMGFYCASPQDECASEAACPANMFCGYHSALKRWKCTEVTCVGRPG